MILAHAKDTYLYGHLDTAGTVLHDYLGIIESYEESSEWVSLSEPEQIELTQLKQEIQVLLHRLDANLDYFGNPTGWVPMLSFEANYLAYQQEIERAIRVLYLAYWLENNTQGLDRKINALNAAKAEAFLDIEALQAEYQALVTGVPGLKAKLEEMKANREALEQRLTALEATLRQQAEDQVREQLRRQNDVPWWQSALRLVGSVASLIPLPEIQMLGRTLTVGEIGAKMIDLSNLDLGQSIPDIWEDLQKDDWTATDSSWWSQELTTENGTLGKAIEQVGADDSVSLIDELKNVAGAGAPLLKELERYQKLLQPAKTNKGDVKGVLANLRANSPELRDLVADIQQSLVEANTLSKEIDQMIQRSTQISSDIEFDVLAIDGMNQDLGMNIGVLSQRTRGYVQEMAKRAQWRLLKYQYYMAKGFEYRFLQPYTGEPNLSNITDDILAMVEASMAAGGDHQLSAADFDALKAVYEEQLSRVAEDILDRYNANPPSLSGPVTLRFTDEQIQALNRGESVTINFVDMGIFPLNEENVRINSLEIVNLEVHPDGGDPGMFGRLDVNFEHSGMSLLASGGKNYYFNHYTAQTENPIRWVGRYDWGSGAISPILPSAADESLLRALLGGSATNETLLIYSRPAAWSDISVNKQVHTQTGADLIIDKLTIRLQYDYTPKPSTRTKLHILASEPDLEPYFILSRADNNGRRDGTGDFYRSYNRSSSTTVAITAPAVYGEWVFDKWTDQYGTPIGSHPGNPTITVNLGSDQTIKAKMRLTRTLNVPAEYGTIQSAIDAALAGDTVRVGAGTYEGNLVLKDGVSLESAGDGPVFLVGNGTGPVVTAVGIGDSTRFDGLTVRNGSASNGGGMYVEGSTLVIANSVFCQNSATSGGGICISGGSPSILNCTLWGNSADSGGGIYCNASSPRIINSIIWGNTPDQVSASSGSTPAVSFSDVQGGYSGTGNTDADPGFVNPSCWDFSLGAGSPCIDAGNDHEVEQWMVVDSRGGPRIQTGQGSSTASPFAASAESARIVDMGAAEYSLSVPAWDINADSKVDYKDLAILGSAYGTGAGDPGFRADADINQDGVINYKDLAMLGAHYGEVY